MSELSQAYRDGVVKLLPDVNKLAPAHLRYYPDIREPGNEALAWRALVALVIYRNGQGLRLPGDASMLDAALYAAIEAVGRES